MGRGGREKGTHLSQDFLVESHAAIWTLDIVHHAPGDYFRGGPHVMVYGAEHETEDPHCEADGAVGHADGELQWLGFLYQAIPRAFGIKLVQCFDRGVFVRGSQSQGIALKVGGIGRDDPHVIQYGQHRGRIITGHISKGDAAEIATLDHVMGVTQLFHECVESIAGLSSTPACLARCGREAEARYAGRHDVERWCGSVGWIEETV